MGTVANLETTNKNTLVEAINEVKALADSAFQEADNGKIEISNAIVGKGGIASPQDSFLGLASAITALPTGGGSGGGISIVGFNTFTGSLDSLVESQIIPLNKTIDPTKTVVLINAVPTSTDGNTSSASVVPNLNSQYDQITVIRRFNGRLASIDFQVQVIELSGNVIVHRGVRQFSGTSLDVTLTGITDYTKCLPIVYGYRGGTSQSYAQTNQLLAKLTSNTNMTIQQAINTENEYHYQIIEFLD